MSRLPVSRIGDAHEVTPTRIYVGASATGEQWSRVLIDAVVSGRTVRVLVDELTVPTLDLMVTVTGIATAGGLSAWWSVVPFPLSVDLTVTATVAPAQPEGSHGNRDTFPAGQDGAPSPTRPPVGEGTTSATTSTLEES